MRLLLASDRATFLYLRLAAFRQTMDGEGDQMTASPGRARVSDVVVEIGGLPIRLRCADPAFVHQIEERYAGYVYFVEQTEFPLRYRAGPARHRLGR